MSEEKIFMRVDEVAETLGISKSHAYKIVHQLNKEMAQMPQQDRWSAGTR